MVETLTVLWGAGHGYRISAYRHRGSDEWPVELPRRQLELDPPRESEICDMTVSLSETSVETIEQAFKSMTSRKDIAMILINQHVGRRRR